jgi:large subunit ribosomal protein L33
MPKRNRPYIALRSKEDPSTVYMTSKNPKNTTERLSLKKYSARLRKHIVFTESK